MSELPVTPEGVGELSMHYDEALDWIDALEHWVRQQGLEVPTWPEVEAAGWSGRKAVYIKTKGTQ